MYGVEMWYKSQGTLKYYPWGDWWVILNCCDELASFYRMMAQREMENKLSKPKHGSHISVVRGEGEPENKENWLWKNEELINFEYCSEIIFGETHVWLPVRSEELVELRKKLGLTEQPPFGFHLTLGRKV